MVPHRNPTNTSRRVQSRPHPILTEIPSNPCDHNDPTSEHKGAQETGVRQMHILVRSLCRLPKYTSSGFPSNASSLTPFDSRLSIASPNAPPSTDQGGIDTPPSPNCHLVLTPQKCSTCPGSTAPNSVIFRTFGTLYPQTPLTILNSLCSQKKKLHLA